MVFRLEEVELELSESFFARKMERKELNLNRDCGAGNNCKGGDGFIDRSKVRILLCDNDSKSLEEVMTLLLKCSYQGMYCFLYLFICLFLLYECLLVILGRV